MVKGYHIICLVGQLRITHSDRNHQFLDQGLFVEANNKAWGVLVEPLTTQEYAMLTKLGKLRDGIYMGTFIAGCEKIRWMNDSKYGLEL